MQESRASQRSVIVVGAGPVGLSAALAIRARGLPVTLLEAGAEGRERAGSRAIFVHRESLVILERSHAGLGWRIASEGLVWTTKRTFWGEREVYARTYPPGDPSVLPPFTSLPQVRTEDLLLAACREAGVELVWSSPVSGARATAEGAVLTTEGGAEWKADYVIAADGARSAVRRAIGVEMEGDRSESSFVIADIAEDADDPRPPERVFYYEHPAVEGRNVLLVPFAGGWRADLQCRVDDDPQRFNDEAGVRRWIPRVLPAKYAERLQWVSTYQFLQMVAGDFADRERRILLVGEAAHLFAPFGARGMNSGIADAAAAADAVVQALADRAAGRRAVEEFVSRRRAAALRNREAAATALAAMQARDPWIRAKRFVAAQIAIAGARAGEWLDAAPYGPRSTKKGSTY